MEAKSMETYNYHDFLALIGVGGAHPGGLALTKQFLKSVQINQHSKILDAGCGTGQSAAYLAKTYGCHVTALDQHPIMLQKAKQRFTRENVTVELIQGDIEHIPLTDESFDLILVESVTIFTDIDKSLSEYARLLRNEGEIFDLEMTAVTSFPEKMMQKFKSVYEINEVPTESGWKSRYRKAGFQSIETVSENSLAKALNAQSLQTSSDESPEFDPSDSIDQAIYQIWNEHQLLSEKYAEIMRYNVYRGTKKSASALGTI